jgi:hypothetical protein
MPGYNSKGDQPYRPDWTHPNSVEDSKPMFGATHLGLLANWTTMMDRTWGVTVGVTYDYYNVTGAKATTNLNGGYYMDWLSEIFEYEYHRVYRGKIMGDSDPEWNEMLSKNYLASGIVDLYASCGNSWTCTFENEVSGFYKSVGIRIGVTGKF